MGEFLHDGGGRIGVARRLGICSALREYHAHFAVPALPARAGATIATLILILVCSMAVLIPQTALALGAEILAFGICGWLLKTWSAYRAIRDGARAQRPASEAVSETLLGQIQVLPFMVGGVLLMAGGDSGFYWVAGGVISAFVFSVFNGWVLLVEILR